MSKQWTRADVQARASEQKGRGAFFVIDNTVYDATPFLDEHPGGHEVLVNASGGDATENFDDVGHSLDAKELMKKYVVGELVPEDRIERKKHRVWTEANMKEEQQGSFIGSWQFPLLLAVVATLLYLYLSE